MYKLENVHKTIKAAGNSFQHFSNSFTLKDKYYFCLTSDAKITVPRNAKSLVNKLRLSFIFNRLP